VQEAPEVPENGPAIHFIASSDALTRTVFGEKDGTTYRAFWSGGETVAISLNYEEAEKVGITVNDARNIAEFDYTPAATSGPYTFFVVTPASALNAPSKSRGALTLTVPAAQKPLAGSVDEAAQIFYAKTDELPEKPASVNVQFNHLTAYGRLTLKNVKGTPVRLTLVADQPWAGTCYVSLSDGTVSAKEGSHTLTLDLANCPVSGGNLNDIWFACLPTDLAGKPLTVLLETADGTTRKRTIPSLGTAVRFTSGNIIHFSVDMASAEQASAVPAPDVLNYEEYGAYIPGNPLLYDPETDQLSREYTDDGTVTFSLLDPVQDAFVEFSGIPAEAAFGDAFTLTVRHHGKVGVAYDATFDVCVVKEEGARLWLSDGTNGFIVKR
jgi:hypothetical protein